MKRVLRHTIAQKGFASIIVAALLMVVLALITLGFTRLMQREQQQALDRQLSRQALYAAESGVNDVIDAISSGVAGYLDDSKSTCDVSALPGGGNLEPSGNVAYTCALFDKTPGALDYDVVADRSRIVQLNTSTTNNFESLTVAWGHEDSLQNNIGALPSCGTIDVQTFPATRNSVVPILRFDLTRTAAPYTRAELLQYTDYMYLVPCDGTSGGTHSFNTTDRGNIVEVPCSGTGVQPCSITIDALAPASNSFFARLRPVYQDAVVSISGVEIDPINGPQPVQFEGAQISVDVTARAGDVLRRLRVSTPFETTDIVPETALHNFDGICKRLDIINETPGSVDVRDNCFGGGGAVSPACGSGFDLNFSDYSAGVFADNRDRNRINDVLYRPGVRVARILQRQFSNPDIEILGADVLSHPGCKYQVEYTAYCTSNLVDWGVPPPDCITLQPYEAMRVWLYEASLGPDPTTYDCRGGVKLAYYDTRDNSRTLSDVQWTETVDVTVVREGTPNCIEIEHICVATGAPTGVSCGVRQSSIYIHDMKWRVL